MHLLEPLNASLSSLMTRTEMVVKTLVYLPFNYLMQMLARESLIEQFNVAPQTCSEGYKKCSDIDEIKYR
jgi:hypothetical protein